MYHQVWLVYSQHESLTISGVFHRLVEGSHPRIITRQQKLILKKNLKVGQRLVHHPYKHADHLQMMELHRPPKAPDPPSRDSRLIVEASPHGTAPPRSSSRFVSLERSCPLPYEDHLVLSPAVFSVGGTVFLLIFVTIQLLPTTLYNQNTYFLHLDMPRCAEYTRRMEMQSRVDMMGHGRVWQEKLHLVRIMNM